jgi:Molydopterin dinucleotide binding domain
VWHAPHGQSQWSASTVNGGDHVGTRRGRVKVLAQVGDVLPGHLFMPFHYGTWDDPSRRGAANELTLTGWDPVSKQPHFKFAAAWLRKA